MTLLSTTKKPLREGEVLLHQFKLGYKKVYASEFRQIAYVDQFGRAKTCYFSIVNGKARLNKTRLGWPIEPPTD